MADNIYKIRLKKGDNVVVLIGKEKGKSGKVLSTHPKLNKVTVENINVVKRHMKKTEQNPQSGIVEKTKPIPVSNVAIIEPSSKRPSKIGYNFDKAGNKVRVYKINGKEVK